MVSRALWIATAVVVACGSLANAAAEEIKEPDWKTRPSAELVGEVYPPVARRLRIEGSAAISCDVTAQGRLINCSVISERPIRLGFGAAALAMAPAFEMSPQKVGGKSTAGGQVRIPVRFKLPPLKIASLGDVDKARLAEAEAFLARLPEDQLLQITDRDMPFAGVSFETHRAAQDAIRTAATPELRARLRSQAARQMAAAISLRDLQAGAGSTSASVAEKYRSLEPEIEREAARILMRHQNRVAERARQSLCASRDCRLLSMPTEDKSIEDRPPPTLEPAKLKGLAAPVFGFLAGAPAQRIGVEGWALVDCEVGLAKSLQNCFVADEGPARLGFGEAALQRSAQYRAPAEAKLGERIPTLVKFEAARPFKSATIARPAATARALALAEQVAALQLKSYRSRSAQGLQAPTSSARGVTPPPPPDLARELLKAEAAEFPNLVQARAFILATYLLESDLAEMLNAMRAHERALARRPGSDAPFAGEPPAYGEIIARARDLFCDRRDCGEDEGPAP